MLTKDQIIKLIKEKKFEELCAYGYDPKSISKIGDVEVNIADRIFDAKRGEFINPSTALIPSKVKDLGLFCIGFRLPIEGLRPRLFYIPTTPQAETAIKEIKQAFETLDKVLQKYTSEVKK